MSPLGGEAALPMPWSSPGVCRLAGILALSAAVRREGADLDHDLRKRMLEVLEDRPALNEVALAEELGVHPTTVHYHGSVLARKGLVWREADGRELLYYLSGRAESDFERTLQKVMERPSKRRVITLYRENPRLTLSEAAERLDCHPSTVKRHADVLVREGILEEDYGDGCRRVELTDRAERVLEKEAPA